MSRLAILDGSWFMFRAYYGIPPLNDPQGRPVQLIYGTIKMFMQILLQDYEHIAIARDAWSKTVRHDAFVDYKANRAKAPDDLSEQIVRTHELITDLRIPSFVYPGYEADDIIATRAYKAYANPNMYTTVMSSDKDLKQLINDRVDVRDPMKNKKTNLSDFQREFGFAPAHMRDYLALIGDASDNIPGIAGIGPKTASDLIKQYGSIEAIYADIDGWTINKSIMTKLDAWRDMVAQALQLVGLLTVPEMETLAIAPSCTREPDMHILRHLLLDVYDFQSLSPLIDKLEKKITKPAMQGLFG